MKGTYVRHVALTVNNFPFLCFPINFQDEPTTMIAIVIV